MYGIYEWSACQIIALYYAIILYWVRAACKLRSVSYGSTHASRSLCDTSFCAYIHTPVENWRSYEDILPIKQLLYYWRYLFLGLELCAKYDGESWLQTCIRNLFPIWQFVCTYTHNSKTVVFSLLESPTMTSPLARSWGCTFMYLWNLIRPSPRLFMAT